MKSRFTSVRYKLVSFPSLVFFSYDANPLSVWHPPEPLCVTPVGLRDKGNQHDQSNSLATAFAVVNSDASDLAVSVQQWRASVLACKQCI